MVRPLEYVVSAVVIGVGATAISDAWTVIQRKLLRIPSLDYRLVGRWIGRAPTAGFIQSGLSEAHPVRREALLGWTVHYAIGIAFAMLLLSLVGVEWTRRPTPWPALAVGLATVLAPLFVLQPALGMGVAGSKTPHPMMVRVRSLFMHVLFGFGMYLSALLWSRLGGG